jgi:cell division protein FtsB
MRLRRLVWPVLVSVVAVVVLFAAVFPTRTYLAQRASISRAEEQLAVLDEQNRALEERAAELRDDAEIERLAREQYNLVRPGEEAYALLPSPAPPAPAASTPAGGAEALGPPAPDEDEPGLLERAWDTLTGWL